MRIILLICFCWLFLPCQAQEYRPGDFLFLDLDCGPLCDAIEAVTQGYDGQSFSHVGMVVLKNDSVYIVEAIGKAVVLSPLSNFLAYTKKPAWHFRLQDSLQHRIQPALNFALQKLGMPYDDVFLPNNGKYYCSELIFDAFQSTGSGPNPFRLEPMEYRKPGTTEIFPVWKAYFEKRGIPVPQSLPGCNPGGLSRSPALYLIGKK
jgi:hypothetical protein